MALALLRGLYQGQRQRTADRLAAPGAFDRPQFLLRGVEKVASEWGLVCLAHNILKLAQRSAPFLPTLAVG